MSFIFEETISSTSVAAALPWDTSLKSSHNSVWLYPIDEDWDDGDEEDEDIDDPPLVSLSSMSVKIPSLTSRSLGIPLSTPDLFLFCWKTYFLWVENKIKVGSMSTVPC